MTNTKEITLSVTVEEINTMLNALGNMPFIQVQGLIAKLQTQAGQQLHEMQNGKAEKPAKKSA